MENPQPDNLSLWSEVCETDPKHTKKANNGKYDFTAVDPAHQLHAATKLWGPYGNKWGLRKCKFERLQITEGKESLVISAEFYCPESVFEIYADMPYRWNDDAYKKLTTAARSKALSLVGFNADIYLGSYDDERYVSELTTKYADEDELRSKVLGSIRRAATTDILSAAKARLEELRGNGAINKTLYSEGLQLIEQQNSELTNGAPTLDEQDAIRQQELHA